MHSVFQHGCGLWCLKPLSTIFQLNRGSTGVPRENHQPAASHSQNLSHYVVSSTTRHEQVSCKSNYHTITTTTAPIS
jgi:hypothetical protein